MTLDELVARRETLQAIRFSPVKECLFDGKQVTYNSDTELANALAALDAEIAAAAGRPARRLLRCSLRNGLT